VLTGGRAGSVTNATSDQACVMLSAYPALLAGKTPWSNKACVRTTWRANKENGDGRNSAQLIIGFVQI
jgi:hypothetical protein